MVKNREYLYSINNFKTPKTVEDKDAIGIRLVELIDMEPGSDPLHPDMGIGIKKYRFNSSDLEDLQNRISSQIETYLPMYSTAEINIIRTAEDKTLNIEITIGDITYVYDTEIANGPVTLEDI